MTRRLPDKVKLLPQLGFVTHAEMNQLTDKEAEQLDWAPIELMTEAPADKRHDMFVRIKTSNFSQEQW
jgi:hypothetical protein